MLISVQKTRIRLCKLLDECPQTNLYGDDGITRSWLFDVADAYDVFSVCCPRRKVERETTRRKPWDVGC